MSGIPFLVTLYWVTQEGHVARTGRPEMRTKFWTEILKGQDHLGDIGIDGRIIFKWKLGKKKTWFEGVDCFNLA
jgi:hypothetical protein